MGHEKEATIVGRLEVDRFLVGLPDGTRAECGITEALARSRWEMGIGDHVRVAQVGSAGWQIYFRYPRDVAPTDSFRRAELIRKGTLRPKGTYDERAHDPPPLDTPVLRIDHVGKRAAAARVERGGTDRDFERERYGRP